MQLSTRALRDVRIFAAGILLSTAVAAQQLPPLPAAVDLRPEIQRLGLTPRSQGRRPTCSVFTVVSTLELALASATGQAVRLSPEFANRAKNVVTGRPHDGGFFHDILAGLAARGIVRESSFPYAERFDPDATAAISADALAEEAEDLRETIARRLRVTWVKPWSATRKGLDDAQFEQVRSALARGLAVGTGMAHSRTLVGYQDRADAPGGGVFVTLDSALGRFAEVSYEFVRTELFDVFYLDVVPEQPRPAASPNVLLILADDMGYGDLGCTGSTVIRTPAIDALAARGVLCTRGYVASPVCSPSRAGLLTGRDPRRFGYESNLNAGSASYPTRPELLGLSPSERTVADYLRMNGYTTALVGKWHQGMTAPFHPNARGFDHFCGMLGGSHGYFPQPGKHSIERNGAPVESFSSPYLTDFFTDEAAGWVRAQHGEDPDRPWFLFLSYNAPHTPMQATAADLAACAHIGDERRRTYAAMMRALDRGVGRMLDLLDELDEREDTLVVFLSDNGGATNNASWNGPLSGAKGCLREGGVRVPMIWSWPARLPTGAHVDVPTSALDLLPTFVAAAGGALPELLDRPPHEDAGNRRRYAASFGGDYDGIDATALLLGQTQARTGPLFWRLQGQAAVLLGEDKLVRLSHRPAQLFRPAADLGERQDLIDTDPDATAALFALLGDWEAKLPTAPLFSSSPYWAGQSAKIHDTWAPRPEPK